MLLHYSPVVAALVQSPEFRANVQPNPIVKTLALPDLAVSVIEISASDEEYITHGL